MASKEDKDYVAHMILTLVSTIVAVFSGLHLVKYYEFSFIYGLILTMVLSVSIYSFGIFLIDKRKN
jgi:hypothetical protein